MIIYYFFLLLLQVSFCFSMEEYSGQSQKKSSGLFEGIDESTLIAFTEAAIPNVCSNSEKDSRDEFYLSLYDFGIEDIYDEGTINGIVDPLLQQYAADNLVDQQELLRAVAPFFTNKIVAEVISKKIELYSENFHEINLSGEKEVINIPRSNPVRFGSLYGEEKEK